MTTESQLIKAGALTKSYFKGPQVAPLTQLTIGQYLENIVDNYPEREAIVVSHQSVRLNYREYLAKINQLAASLLAVGIKPGDRVGIWSPNNLEWSLVQFATAKIGAIMVCINPAYRPSELEYVLNNVECKMLVMAKSFKHSHYVDMIRELAPESYDCMFGELSSQRLPSLKQIVLIDEDIEPGLMNFSTLLSKANDAHYLEANAIAANLNACDAINIQFTSGTTGNPKGATLTHSNILNNGLLVANAMKLTEQDKLCIPVPLYHCFGMVLGNLVCISKGACAVFPNDSF